MESQTMLTLAESVQHMPPQVAQLAFVFLHGSKRDDLDPVVRQGLIQALMVSGHRIQPLNRVDIAVAEINGLDAAGVRNQAVTTAYKTAMAVIDECDARQYVLAVADWWCWVLATVGRSGSTLH